MLKKLILLLFIVFCQTGTIVLEAKNVEESVVRLTNTNAKNGQPFWSPDGKKISFVSNRTGKWQVWIMSADGSNPQKLTDVETTTGFPSWSPDGKNILYYTQTAQGFKLYKLNIFNKQNEPIFENKFDDFRPLISPNGKFLLFDRVGNSEKPNHDLYSYNLANGTLKQITNHLGYDSDGRWSPNGKQIVFHSDRDSPNPYKTQIYLMNADGSNLKQLTKGLAVNSYPAWSPNGKYIVYTSEIEGNRDIWMMKNDGTKPTRITFHKGFDSEPAWSPDGKYLVFATDRFGGVELAKMPVPSENVRG